MQVKDLTGYEEFNNRTNLEEFVRNVHLTEGKIDTLLSELSQQFGITVTGFKFSPVREMNTKGPVAYFPTLEFEI